MKTSLCTNLVVILAFTACTSSRNSSQPSSYAPSITEAQVEIASNRQPQSLMDLPQTQYGGFVLKPGFYEADFKTYCLQPGTPSPRQGDAYLQGPITGYRKEIVESILLNSRDRQDMDQRNIQLLLWSVVSGSDFNNLSYSVQTDAIKLLTPKQIFELKGGVVGVIKKISNSTGLLNANNDIKRLFQTSITSYEAYEKIAVLQEQSKAIKKAVKYDQWYKQRENYYVRYFPESYQKVKVQVYVPEGLLDADNKLDHEYVVFDPTGQQAIPAFTNAQRLGIGGTIANIVRAVIQINKQPRLPKKPTKKKDNSNI